MVEKDRRSVPTAPSNVFWDKASAVRKTVSAEVLGLLTTRQRAEYDASPVIDPSKASGLNP
jgi:hypothetical protein